MKFISNLVERDLHLLKAFHFDDSSARFFGKSGNPAVWFVSKDVADVAVVTTGPGGVLDFHDIGNNVAFFERTQSLSQRGFALGVIGERDDNESFASHFVVQKTIHLRIR